jgi:hypothetical protein
LVDVFLQFDHLSLGLPLEFEDMQFLHGDDIHLRSGFLSQGVGLADTWNAHAGCYHFSPVFEVGYEEDLVFCEETDSLGFNEANLSDLLL